MRILLDESMPTPIRPLLMGHVVRTVVECGWEGMSNGKLLALAATSFDVVLTADRNKRYQQNLKKLPIAVVVLQAGREMKAGLGRVVYSPLIAARKNTGLSPEQFAALLGISTDALEALEQKRCGL